MSIRTDAANLPYEDRSVTFIRWLPDGLDACDDRATKREWLATGERLYAGWTGRYCTNVFAADLEAAKRALGMSP